MSAVSSTASAERMSPLGCAPTSSSTPRKPTKTPASFTPVTRWLRVNQHTNSAVNRGIDACSTAARPESSRFSLHASSQNGSAALRIPSSSSGPAKRRRPAHARPHPPRNDTAGSSASVPVSTRPKTTSPGVTSRTATLMNMKEEPQIAARASSMGSGRRLNAPTVPPARLGPLTQVAPEQPLHRALGLTDGELDRIRELLTRDPNHFELAVFSLLWSEHCGYKHSALLLKRLPSEGEGVLQGPGENAGVIDLGDGEAVAFKVESHNHPSAVEPFQGAATGIGGILRDIVAMGARPIALLDGLRFAEPSWQFDRAVAGIGHYGNCLAADEQILLRNSGTARMQS